MSSSAPRRIAKTVAALLVLSAAPVHAAENGLLTRPSLLGAPAGLKAKLRVYGITTDASLTQFAQGLASGDGDRGVQSGGKGDILVALDGRKFGLWDGVSANLHAEFVFGDDANAQGSGTLIPVNTALAFPRSGDSDQELSFTLTQRFRQSTLLTLGKFNMLDAASRTPLIGGGGIDTFMNLGLAAPISGVTPAYLLGGLLTHRTDFATFSAFLYDPRSAQDSDTLKHPFDDGVTLSLSAAVPTRLFGNTTIHRARGVYSTQEGIDLRDIPQLQLPPGAERTLGTRSGYWFFSYAFQHFLFQDEADPSRGWGVFGQVAVSDGNPNPVARSGFLGLGGNSLLPGRERDRFGLAYFRYSLSNDLVDGLRPAIRLQDEQGIEAFYNFAMLKWLRLTGNLQVIDPAFSDNDRAVYLGLRTQVIF